MVGRCLALLGLPPKFALLLSKLGQDGSLVGRTTEAKGNAPAPTATLGDLQLDQRRVGVLVISRSKTEIRFKPRYGENVIAQVASDPERRMRQQARPTPALTEKRRRSSDFAAVDGNVETAIAMTACNRTCACQKAQPLQRACQTPRELREPANDIRVVRTPYVELTDVQHARPMDHRGPARRPDKDGPAARSAPCCGVDEPREPCDPLCRDEASAVRPDAQHLSSFLIPDQTIEAIVILVDRGGPVAPLDRGTGRNRLRQPCSEQRHPLGVR